VCRRPRDDRDQLFDGPRLREPGRVCTAGNVTSENLQGTTWFSASTTQPGPPPGLDFYTGDLVITTADAPSPSTITACSIIPKQRGLYFEVQEVTSGTGAQAGKTGMLVSQGTATSTGFKGYPQRLVLRTALTGDSPGPSASWPAAGSQ